MQSLTPLTLSKGLKWGGVPGKIGAWIAESDFGTAPVVLDALDVAVREEIFTYMPRRLDGDTRNATSTFLSRRYDWEVTPEQVRLVSDVVAGLRIAIDWFSNPAAPVIVPTPAYSPFLTVPRHAHRTVIQSRMVRSGTRWTLNLDEIERIMQANPGTLLILCNPHNPLGTVMRRSELEELSAVVSRTRGRVFADEIHAPIVYAGEGHVPYASVNEAAADHTVTCTAASKGWNIPGLRCAQMVLTSPADRKLWEAEEIVPLHSGSVLGAKATIAAYSGEGMSWLDLAVNQFSRNRELFCAEMTHHLPYAHFDLPEATFLAWVDFSRYLLPDPPARFFESKAGVKTVDGASAGLGFTRFLRFNFAMDPDHVVRAVSRMAGAVEETRREQESLHASPAADPFTPDRGN